MTFADGRPARDDALPALSPNYASAHPSAREGAYRDGVQTHGAWPVEYQFRPARGDHRHLLVVFSAVGSKYGFGNALEGVRCNILRIRDHFAGGASYYVCRNMDFSVSDSVQSLIESHMRRLRVTREEVTLLGASKGGTAALYYGLRYGYKNIVASTPQYFQGRYSRHERRLGDSVLGEGRPAENAALLDSVMKDLLERETDFNRNIYVVSSPEDPEYEQEVTHYLPALRAYRNFNLVLVRSPTVRRHDEVVKQGLPAIWSMVHALTEGAAPRWGEVRIGPAPEDPEQAAGYLARLRGSDTALAVLRHTLFVNGMLHLSGHAFIPGVSPGGAAEESKRLVLETDGRTWVYELASTREIRLYRAYFDEYFCEYAQGGFASREEIPLAELPRGTFETSVCVASRSEGIERRTRLISAEPVDRRHAVGDSEVLVRGGKDGVTITKRSIIGNDSAGACFALEKSWERQGRIHAEGVFFLPGRDADRAAHAAYYLVLHGGRGCYSFPLTARPNAPAVRRRVRPDDLGRYDFGYFSTPAGKGGGEGAGVDAGDVPPGRYSLLVSMSAGGALFTRKAGEVTLRPAR
jgi:hypothetical protein